MTRKFLNLLAIVLICCGFAHGGIPGGPTPPQPVFSIGINLVGAQNSFPSFPSTAQINYHANRLHGSLNPIPKFRFAIGWSQINNDQQFNSNNHLVGIQPVAFGALDTTSTVYGGISYVAQMNRVIGDVMAAGGQVLIDIHTFGAGAGGDVGSVACPFSCFGDLWGKIANYYVHVRPDLLPGIYGFDLMNEWTFINSSIAFNGNQAAITAARANGYTGPIYIEGVNFSSAWNWTSGQGQSFNNSNLYQLNDPLNNLISSAHMYPDPDDSGSQGAQTFAYQVAVATAGSAPTGLNVNPTIAVTRINREWQPWLALHGLRGHLGEYGNSIDTPWIGGLFDYADWNTITRNLLTYLQTNKIEISVWASGNGGAGYGPNGYGYSLDPFSSDLSGNYDFTGTGIQEPMWTVLDSFTGYTGPQPTAYALFQPGLNNPALYGSVGSPSQPFTIYYGGKITSPVTITPHATLMDGTDGSGTFTPATVTLAAGDNALATFTYTPNQVATFRVSTTNNQGWSDPPVIGWTSNTDQFVTASHKSNLIALRRIVAPYIGPAIRLARADATQMDFFFNNRGDLPRQAILDWASSTTINIVRIYSQDGIPAHDFIPIIAPSAPAFAYVPSLANTPTLTLVNAAGYPEVTVVSGQFMFTSAPSGVSATPGVGQGLLTLLSRASGSGAGLLLDQENFNTQFRLGTSTMIAAPNGSGGGSVSLGTNTGYHTVAGTYSNLYAVNNQNGYVDGSVVAQTSAPQFTFQPVSADQDTAVNGFRYGGQNFSGAWQEDVITFDELSPSVMAAIAADNATYYSTPLPDPLVFGPPGISFLPAAQTTVTSHFFPPFGMGPFGPSNIGVTVVDPSPTATDSATITITGDAGATITGAGITGSNPYTTSSMSSLTLTSLLQILQYQSSSSVGTVGTVSLVINSSTGGSISASTTITVGAVVAETPLAAPSGCTFTPPTFIKGVNISDAQVHYPTSQFNYIYPQTEEINYFSLKGMTAIRLPLTAPRIQPWAYRPLDPVAFVRVQDSVVGRQDEQATIGNGVVGNQTNLVQIKNTLDLACANNMYVLLEPHDFGGIHDNRTKTDRIIGADAEATAMFRDWWTRFATVFKNYPNVVFQEQNEPSVQTAAQWQAAAALVTSDIAAVTTTHTVMVQGVNFDGCLAWVSGGSGAAWHAYTPPAGLPVVFECHQYLDAGNSGTSATCAPFGGETGFPTDRMNAFDAWLVTEGQKGFVGEVGFSSNSSCMTSATVGPGPDFMAYLSARDARYAGWTYWLGGSVAFEGGYIYTVVPTGYPTGPFTDKPQMQVLINNLP